MAMLDNTRDQIPRNNSQILNQQKQQAHYDPQVVSQFILCMAHSPLESSFLSPYMEAISVTKL